MSAPRLACSISDTHPAHAWWRWDGEQRECPGSSAGAQHPDTVVYRMLKQARADLEIERQRSEEWRAELLKAIAEISRLRTLCEQVGVNYAVRKD